MMADDSQQPESATSWQHRLFDRFGRRDNWANSTWWLLMTVGAGLAQVWILLLFILSFVFFPAAAQQFGPWDISRILGDSVLLFFATSLLGQTIYALTDKSQVGTPGRFLWFLITANFIAILILYFQTMLWGESSNKWKYLLDVLFATQVLVYAGYVEFRRRQRLDQGAVQEGAG